MIPEQFIHQVQQATDIVELIGQYVTIRRRGKDYLGLCPFHQEKTPSFSVSSSKQIFKCFGCGAGGGVFQFVMQQQKCTFIEAVRSLADRAGIHLPSAGGETAEAGMNRPGLLRLMRFATEFYQQQLRGPNGAEALNYTHGRRLTDESIERFELGYAPQSWDAMYRAAKSAGFSDKQLLAGGLAAQGEQGGYYDRFRHRLMFPIIDAEGRVVAFGGRALAENERAKYLNSPETVLFDKSSSLYGLAWARKAIADGDQAVVVEGYFDVLLPAQAGVENVVATLGTALTDRHARMLSRLARDLVLIFDSDTAGAAAAERGLELCIAQQMNVRVAAVPDGKDPADYVLAAGAEAFRQLIAEAPDALEYVWRKRSAEFAASEGLVEKRRAAEEFLGVVVRSSAYGTIGAVQQGLLVNRLAHLLGASAGDLNRQIRQLARRVTGAAAGRADAKSISEPMPMGISSAKRRILEVLIAEPELFDHAARYVGVEAFADDPILSGVAREVWRLGDQGQLSLESLLAVEAGSEWGRVLTDLVTAGQQRANYAATLGGDLDLIEHHHRRQELRDLRRVGDDEALRKLADRLKTPDARRRPW
ncbi:MAG: DNA primase [Planctomycetes bacterium]|nr:DNA primase [Planctomycetota bacterium]